MQELALNARADLGDELALAPEILKKKRGVPSKVLDKEGVASAGSMSLPGRGGTSLSGSTGSTTSKGANTLGGGMSGASFPKLGGGRSMASMGKMGY